MPRNMLPYVERNFVKGRNYYYFRRGKGKRIRLPDDPTSNYFERVYAALLTDHVVSPPASRRTKLGTVAALVTSYKATAAYRDLRGTTKASYSTPLEILRTEHGHRTLAGMTKEGIEEKILSPYADRPGQRLSVLKMLRVLIRHALSMTPPLLRHDPSKGIRRPKTKEIRAWTDAEHVAYEARWPLGTKQRTAYELMLNIGTARIDVPRMTWRQLEEESARYSRSKTGVGVEIAQSDRLRAALAQWPRRHVTIINTEFGKPFTTGGFGNFMRDSIDAAGLPKDCKPHGLRKSLGRRLADAGATAHEIMAVLGHRTLEEAERYTREANLRHAGIRAIRKLDGGQSSNGHAQTPATSLGKSEK